MDARDKNHRPRPAIARFAIGLLGLLMVVGTMAGLRRCCSARRFRMVLDMALIAACSSIASLAALPAMQAVHRRRTSRECSEVANGLIDYASVVRREQRGLPLDEGLLARARQLRIPEVITFEFAQHLAASRPSIARGHRATTCLATQAPRGLRAQDAGAHRARAASRSHRRRRPRNCAIEPAHGGRGDAAAGADIADRHGSLRLLAVVARGASRGVSMPELLPLLLALAGVALAVPGFRGLLDIGEALQRGELHRLSAPSPLERDARLCRLRGCGTCLS